MANGNGSNVVYVAQSKTFEAEQQRIGVPLIEESILDPLTYHRSGLLENIYLSGLSRV